MSILEELASQAIRLGHHVLQVEYKDGYEQVFGLTGGVGLEIARFRSTSRKATTLRGELREITRKARRLILQGGEYEVRAQDFSSFGEKEFWVALRPARKSTRLRTTLASSRSRPPTTSLQNVRLEIGRLVSGAFRKRIVLSERAAICLEQLYYDKTPYSWQLRLLQAIMQTTPAIYNSLAALHGAFRKFDYHKLRPAVVGTPFRNELFIRSERDKPQDLRAAIVGLISEPDPGEVIVVHTPEPYVAKRKIVGSTLTVDDLVTLLFWNLYHGQYVSDLAIALLHLARRPPHLGKTNRWWLNTFEQITTKTDAIDPCFSSQQWILYSDGAKYRIRPFGAWSVNQFEESPLKDGSLWIARGNIINRR